MTLTPQIAFRFVMEKVCDEKDLTLVPQIAFRFVMGEYCDGMTDTVCLVCWTKAQPRTCAVEEVWHEQG